MNSEEFFKSQKNRWEGKSGIYVISQPLIKSNGQDIYKVGFAKDSLYTRIRNYKTAYGPAPFLVHIVYQIPQGVMGQKGEFARHSEGRLHKTLQKVGNCAMEEEVGDKKKMLGEWFYNLTDITNNVNELHREYTTDKKYALSRPENWDIEYYGMKPRAYTRSQVKPLIPMSEISSKMPVMTGAPPMRKGRGTIKRNPDEGYSTVNAKKRTAKGEVLIEPTYK